MYKFYISRASYLSQACYTRVFVKLPLGGTVHVLILTLPRVRMPSTIFKIHVHVGSGYCVHSKLVTLRVLGIIHELAGCYGQYLENESS